MYIKTIFNPNLIHEQTFEIIWALMETDHGKGTLLADPSTYFIPETQQLECLEC